MRALLAAVVVVVVAGVWLAAGGREDTGPAGPEASAVPTTTPTPTPTPAPLARFADYEPPGIEPYANAKRLAGRVAQAILTYEPRTSAGRLAASVPTAGGDAPAPGVLRPALTRRQSVGQVVYVVTAGVTETSFGAMVVAAQYLQDERGRRTSVTRTLDIRLRRSGGPWMLDDVASVGGRPVRRPDGLSAAARRVLADPRIRLPDSARWDIYGGEIDDGLLEALSRAAQRQRFSVAVLRTGHPINVWATDRVSAHSRGYAADIFGVGGRLIIAQRTTGSRAYDLTADFLAGGAVQVGSPWVLGPGGSRSFTDAVHEDHIHVQQRPTGT